MTLVPPEDLSRDFGSPKCLNAHSVLSLGGSFLGKVRVCHYLGVIWDPLPLNPTFFCLFVGFVCRSKTIH